MPKITALTALAAADVATSTDVLPIVDISANATKKITVDALMNAGTNAVTPTSGTMSITGDVSGSNGFMNTGYTSNARNPIWRISTSTAYGMSYFQGTAGYGGANDSIGFHFGTATANGSAFNVLQGGGAFSNGQVYAGLPSAQNTTFRGFKYAVVGDATDYGGTTMNINTGEVRHEAGFTGWGGFHTFYGNGAQWWQMNLVGSFLPGADNTYNVGSGGARVGTYYGATGTINTSDAREKTPLRPLNEREVACALELAKMGPGVFQWLDAVAKKGDNARLHIGFTVQQVMAVMEKHGLDPLRYAFICYDKWGQEVAEDGTVTKEAGDRWGFRSGQLTDWVVGTTLKAVVERLGL